MVLHHPVVHVLTTVLHSLLVRMALGGRGRCGFCGLRRLWWLIRERRHCTKHQYASSCREGRNPAHFEFSIFVYGARKPLSACRVLQSRMPPRMRGLNT
jgi:hypothetical protein